LKIKREKTKLVMKFKILPININKLLAMAIQKYQKILWKEIAKFLLRKQKI